MSHATPVGGEAGDDSITVVPPGKAAILVLTLQYSVLCVDSGKISPSAIPFALSVVLCHKGNVKRHIRRFHSYSLSFLVPPWYSEKSSTRGVVEVKSLDYAC